jgi:hypothetical protein
MHISAPNPHTRFQGKSTQLIGFPDPFPTER